MVCDGASDGYSSAQAHFLHAAGERAVTGAGARSPEREGAGDITAPEAGDPRAFTVHLTNFTGPFDLLLQLIARHKLDVTEIALSTVTDEFITHVRLGQVGEEPWDLDQTTSFIVVAATLLDLKAARLLPQGEVEDPEDLAILEARDLLFARLLQYRAFKQMAAIFQTTLDDQAGRWPRPGGLEDQFTSLLPEVEITAERTVAAIVGPPVMFRFTILECTKAGIPDHNIVLSLERHMKCGVGKCGHCQINGLYTCRDGAVFPLVDVAEVQEAL